MNFRSVSSGDSFRHRYARLHKDLRTEGESSVKKAFAVGLGAFIGFTPFYGLHLILSMGIAHLLKLNKPITYLASHINNPLLTPFILYLEYVIGHRLLQGAWPQISLTVLHPDQLLQTGLVIIIGSLVIGAIVGLFLGVITFLLTQGDGLSSTRRLLSELTTDRYLPCGFLNWEFVRGKLIYDPIYFYLLENNHLKGATRLWDLGCGRGILLCLLASARELAGEDGWSDWSWLSDIRLNGLEARGRDADNARTALGGDGTIINGNITEFTPPQADIILLIDVLPHLPEADQERVISQLSEKLPPGGRLIIREADAHAGWRFNVTKWAERVRAILRGDFSQHYYYRSRQAWQQVLKDNHLQVTTCLMSEGTPFANVLFIAVRGGESVQ